ncbi:unnamed protein product [Leuciscus chuanchicus]
MTRSCLCLRLDITVLRDVLEGPTKTQWPDFPDHWKMTRPRLCLRFDITVLRDVLEGPTKTHWPDIPDHWYMTRSRLCLRLDITVLRDVLEGPTKTHWPDPVVSLHVLGYKTFKIDTSKPQISKDQWFKPFYTGEKIQLGCNMPGDGWKYDWYKDSKPFIRDPMYIIHSASPSDTGVYHCTAKRGDFSVNSETLQLRVEDNTPKPDISKDQWFEPFYTGEKIQLGCNMPGDGWKYDWYKDSKPLITDPTYIIHSASLSDTGVYHCTAKRGDFSVNSETLQVRVEEPPQPELSIESEWKTFYPNEKVILKCSINSNEWGYEWFRNGAQLSDNTPKPDIRKDQWFKPFYTQGRKSSLVVICLVMVGIDTPKPHIRKDQWFDLFYTEEKVQLGCNMTGEGWKYDWYKDSKPLITDPTFTISSASLSNTGVYHCKAKRGDFSVDSETLQVQVQARPPAVLSLETELSDIMSGNILTLRCNVSDGRQWSYAWFENEQRLNGSSDMYKVTATEETIKSEFKCKGIRTERPLYSALSEGFTANNIMYHQPDLPLKTLSPLVLRWFCTCKQDFIFFDIYKTPLEEYMDNSPTEMEGMCL